MIHKIKCFSCGLAVLVFWGAVYCVVADIVIAGEKAVPAPVLIMIDKTRASGLGYISQPGQSEAGCHGYLS